MTGKDHDEDQRNQEHTDLNEDGPPSSYYYDDAHGYEEFHPEDEDRDEDEERENDE